MEHHHHHADSNATTTTSPLNNFPYYFAYAEHKGWLYMHIVTMVVAWVGIMPIATMFALAASRFHAHLQALFVLTTAVGLVFAHIHASSTPDLYPSNSHTRLGWSLTALLALQLILTVLGKNLKRLGGYTRAKHEEEEEEEEKVYRSSSDSGRGQSIEREELNREQWSDAALLERRFGWRDRVEQWEEWQAKHIPWLFNNRVAGWCDTAYLVISRLLIPLAFVQISLGIVVGSGMFMGDRVFNGLAHFIKGGIFFLYGLFTLGRWCGAFAEFGWAWNLPTNPHSRAPSVEFIESALFFTYGVSNIFLEHIASWGAEWTHGDLQHVSIAFMLFGSGLCGMLVESSRILKLLSPPESMPLELQDGGSLFPIARQQKKPTSNPLPALTILILGLLMSSHHQHSALSTAIHTQWGYLLATGALLRLITHLLYFYISYTTSTTPGRPPTEMLVAFCFIAGGAVFMASNKDTVAYLDRSGVDAMFGLTVVVGWTVLLMAWVVGVMAMKGWAVRMEIRRR